ncbi:MAG: hypothetical protein JW941_11850 [Candidatus Coatesbacteria bacterium]|nr:hypothetical protein [Candidatus Coatesbacteria bacterium]
MRTEQNPSELTTWVMAAALCVFVLGAYCLLPCRSPNGDNIGYFLTAQSLIEEGNFDLDEFNSPCFDITTIRHGVHRYSLYPIGPTVVLYPFFLFMRALGISIAAETLAAFVAKLFMALTSAVLFMVFARIVNRAWALILSLGFAFASPVFSNCASEYWSHAPAILFASISIYAAMQRSSVISALVLGFASALAVLSRPQVGIGIAALLLYWLSYQSLRRWAIFAAPIILIAISWGLLGIAICGDPLGPYVLRHNESPGFGDPALWSFLLSPSRGLLVYFPLSALALYIALRDLAFLPRSIWRRLRSAWNRLANHPMPEMNRLSIDDLRSASGIAVVGGILMYASYFNWTGGWCYGNRFTSDLSPWILIQCAALLRELRESKWLRVTALALLSLGFLINLPGAIDGYADWCWATDLTDNWSLERSQVYCSWLGLLGLSNVQLSIQVEAEAKYDRLDQLWAVVRLDNPTRTRYTRSWMAVWGRDRDTEPFEFCRVIEGPSGIIYHGDRRSLNIPMNGFLDTCSHSEVKVEFAFTNESLERVSNIAAIIIEREIASDRESDSD